MPASILEPWIQTLRIQAKDLGVIPFKPNSSQRRLLAEVERQWRAGEPIRIIIVKARQMGMSTLVEALLFLWATLFYPGANQLVIAHETRSSRALFNKTRMFWDTWPTNFRDTFPLSSSTHQRMEFAESRSQVQISTAKNVKSARGETLFGVHASEVAFWDDAETLMVGLAQAVPRRAGTMVILESTANGIGNWFHQQWQRAELGVSGYTPMFFPWYEHEEYRATHEGRPDLVENLGALDTEERWLVENYGVDNDQLAWRRLTIENECKGDLDFFHQEFPATSEEAFLTSGRNVFPAPRLRLCYEPQEPARGFLVVEGNKIEFRPDNGGPFFMYKPPADDINWGNYFVAGDPTYGMHDRACIQVINRRTFEQVAAWHGVIDPVNFSTELINVARFYNDAILTCEVEGPGFATIGAIIAKNYPKVWQHTQADHIPTSQGNKSLGWSSTFKRKSWAINFLLKLVLDADLTIHDKITFAQMLDYAQKTTDPFSPYGPASPDGFDDAVMALAICCICSITDSPTGHYEAPDIPKHPPDWEGWGEAM